MINQLASPSVCVIDDEPDDYNSILNALNDLYISAVWIQGTSLDQLPPQPFTRLQLVFLDLHLTNSLGKDAASHTANVFIKTVSVNTAPVVVVIWSKYADDKVAADGVPPDDQETESELFKRTLLEAAPKFRNRLIFLEMDKPKKEERTGDWTDRLRQQVADKLGSQPAVGLLWTWDGLVKDANATLMASLTDLAEESTGDADPELTDADMKEVLQRLTEAQTEGELTPDNAPANVVAILSQLLADQLEHAHGERVMAQHGTWLAQPPSSNTKASVAPKMNSFLLTTEHSANAIPFGPGTVYAVSDINSFLSVFGVTLEHLEQLLCSAKRATNAPVVDTWFGAVRPIMLEISPVCDVAQRKRYNAHLVGGLAVPKLNLSRTKTSGESVTLLPPAAQTLALRWPLQGFEADEVKLVFHHALKTTLNASAQLRWFSRWFRLRELPTSAVRSPHMSYGSRVGYVSLA